MAQIHHPASESEWLQLRVFDVTSTESPALFGLSPWSTAFELWHQKKSAQVVTLDENERMSWGKALERSIADMVATRYGVKVRRLSAYMRREDVRMGASFDYEIVGAIAGEVEDTILQRLYTEHGPGVLEIKNVDRSVFAANWNSGDEPAAPDHIEIQVQHQLHVIERPWSCIAALVGGNRMYLIPRMRDREVGTAIAAKIVKFWASIESNNAPDPLLPADAEFIGKLCGYAEVGKLLDKRGDERLNKLAAEYKAAGEAAQKADDLKKSAKAELLLAIGDAEKVLLDGFKISASMRAPAEVKAYTRPGYRDFRITTVKEKA